MRKSIILKGGLTLGMGQVISHACSFIRNIIVARLISQEDFGIAVTFAITISILEMTSGLSTDKLLIQAKHGNDPRFQGTAQLIEASRGLIISSILFIFAGPIAILFDAQDAKWAFQVLALLPLLKGLIHLDLHRFQREMKYIPAVSIEAISNLLVTLVAWPLCVWSKNYSAMLWILLVQAGIMMIESHIIAERRYAWSWDRIYLKECFVFGWPLLINGLLMFGIFQGDRFIIGSGDRLFQNSPYTLSDLAVYSVAFSLTLAPTLLVANISTSLFLPLLSRIQDISGQFIRHYIFYCRMVSLAGGMIAIPLVIAGGWIVTTVYGQKYAAAAEVVGWLAAMQALRVIRVGPTLAAMSRADTRNAMVSNMVRTSALLGVIAVAIMGEKLVWIAISGFVGELLALGVCVWRLQHLHAVPANICLKSASISGVGVLLAFIIGSTGPITSNWSMALLSTVVLMILVPAAMLVFFPTLRRDFVLFLKLRPA